MTTNDRTAGDGSVFAELKGPPASRWTLRFFSVLCFCFFAGAASILLFELLPEITASMVQFWRSGAQSRDGGLLLRLAALLMTMYSGSIIFLSAAIDLWRTPSGVSTYRITGRGIAWKVDDEVRVFLSWEEVWGAHFFVPRASSSEAPEMNQYYRGLLGCYRLFFDPFRRTDQQAFLKCFRRNKANSLGYPPEHFVFFLRKGRLRCFLAPSFPRLLWMLPRWLARLLFLGDYKGSYVSSCRRDAIWFEGGPFSDRGSGYSGEAAKRYYAERREQRRRFFLALAEGLVRHGFNPVFR